MPGSLAELYGALLKQEPQGILSAARFNPLMMAKALRQQEANPRPALSSLMNYPQTWQQFGDNIQANYPTDSPAAVRQAAFEAAKNAGPLMTVNAGKPSFNDWWKTQFDENVDRHLPSGYFGSELTPKPAPQGMVAVKKLPDGTTIMRNNEYGWFEAVKDGHTVGVADNASVQVSPEYQRRGIGVELMKAVKDANPSHRFGSHTPEGRALASKYFERYVGN